MSERVVIDCDKCGTPTKESIRIAIPNGTHTEFGGHTSETVHLYERKDLCCTCAENLFKFLFSHKRIDKATKRGILENPHELISNKYIHPTEMDNDAVAITKKFFKKT